MQNAAKAQRAITPATGGLKIENDKSEEHEHTKELPDTGGEEEPDPDMFVEEAKRAVHNLAVTVENQQEENADLKKENADLKKENARLWLEIIQHRANKRQRREKVEAESHST
tara:strand:+ start:642 stop:980 length:339 start_codon:yes stop_codon:yes gene_type:complete